MPGDLLELLFGPSEAVVRILDSITDALFIYDPDGRMVWMNSAARLVHHGSDGRADVRYETIDGQPIPEEEMPSSRALRGVAVGEMAIVARGSDGSSARLSCSAAPIVTPNGVFRGAFVVATDVTHGRQVLHDLEALVSSGCHDLRSPLAAIQGYAQYMARPNRSGATEEQARGAKAIIAAADRMNEMIGDLVEGVRRTVRRRA